MGDVSNWALELNDGSDPIRKPYIDITSSPYVTTMSSISFGPPHCARLLPMQALLSTLRK